MPSAPLRLRCEFVSNPLGVSCANPRLSWWVNDPRPAELQSAYEIIASSTPESLTQEEGDLWMSGRVESDRTAHVEYAGVPLPSGQRVWWMVRTYDSDGLPSAWSDPAFFEVGLLQASDWQGDWIAAGLRGSRSRAVQAVALRREFVLTKAIAAARIYVAALGDYRLEVNGRHIPAAACHAQWSDFEQKIYYQTFDITSALLQEPNAIGVILADGYYAGFIPGAGRASYGDQPQLRLQVVVTCVDGERIFLHSDAQWRWSPSWILAAEINGGEHHDAGQHMRGWSSAGFDDERWVPVGLCADKQAQLSAQPYPGLAIQQVLRPQARARSHANARAHANLGRASRLYDFGDLVLGRARAMLASNAGDEVVFTYGMDEQFALASSDTLTTAAEEAVAPVDERYFEANFALHTFRYLRIEYTADLTEIGDVVALRIAHPEPASFRFRCDHPGLNDLYEVIHNSFRALALTVPMRGASIPERLPDVGYASTWVPLLAQQDHAHAVINKWLLDTQLDCRSLADPSPFVPALPRNSSEGPGDELARFETLVHSLWAIYRYQNDLQLLHHCYAELRVAALSYRHQFTDLIRKPTHRFLYGEGVLGDMVAMCTLYGAIQTTRQIADVLNQAGDIELLDKLMVDIRRALRARYLSRDGHLLMDNQSAYVAALHYDVLDELEVARAQLRLVELIQNANYHADVVPCLVSALLPALTNAGRLDLAYMVILQTSAPSWLATINAGDRLVGSELGRFDIAHAGVLDWLIQSLVGIRLYEGSTAETNGFRMVRVQPMPPFGQQFQAGSPVQFVEASLQTIQGNYEVKWWIKEDCFELELLIPPGCSALVTMPDDIEQRVQSGYHRFVMDFGAGGDGVPTLLDMAGG